MSELAEQTSLNQDQQAAANFVNGIAAVIAVPGSGKTFTMVSRISRLITEHGIAPESIVGLTFTRNAADEMRSRLEPVLGNRSGRVILCTIHSFCHAVLRNEGLVFDILSGKEQIIFVRQIMKEMKLKDLSVGNVLREISLSKNNLVSVAEFRALYEGDRTMLKVAGVYERYDEEKKKRLLFDFDDLLVETHRLLSEREEVRDKYREKCSHILIDEWQDTNPIQLEILKLLIGGNGKQNGSSFWVCGDDWQSIYSFIGASVGNILNFKDLFPHSEEFVLKLNYRSTPQILKACENLIAHNVRQIRKDLLTENRKGHDVVVLESSTEDSEAQNLVLEINDLVGSRGYKDKEIAVLYRANFQSRVIEEVFSQHRIPYHIEKGTTFYQRTEVRNLLDYLRVISNPESVEANDALLNILNVPTRYVSRKLSREIEEYAEERGISVYEALSSMRIEPVYVRRSLRSFREFLNPLIEDAQTLHPSELLGLLRSTLDYDRFITDEDMPGPDDVKIQNLDQLQLAAARFRDIRSFLDYTETFEDELVSDNREGVSLMTIHKAKGLEFKVVFVIGMVEGILPSKKGDMEEERRIAFVACSRAMELLYLSHSITYMGQPSRKSVFIEEALGDRRTSSGEQESFL